MKNNTFPKPTGEYSVGFFDGSFERKGDRQIGYRCFYPAVSAQNTSFYIDNSDFEIIEQKFKGTPFVELYREMLSIKTNSAENAKAAKGVFYPIIYTGGYNNVAWDNLYVIEELVSKGYIVFALSRKDESLCTDINGIKTGKNPEKTKLLEGELLKYMLEAEEYNRENPDPDFVYKWSVEGMQKYVRQCKYAADLSIEWAEDIIFMMDIACKLNDDKENILYGKIHTDKYAAFGNSFGGTCSFDAAMLDKRIAGVLNMDGFMFGGRLLDNKLETKGLVICKSHNHFRASYSDHNTNISDVVINRGINEYMCDFCITSADTFEKFYKNIIPAKLQADIKKDVISGFMDYAFYDKESDYLNKLKEKYKDEISVF